MRIAITGADGFIGRELTRALLREGGLNDRRGHPQPIDSILLVDVALPQQTDARFTSMKADMSEPGALREIAAWKPDAVFHLAAILTSAAERDPARALSVNVSALSQLIELIGDKAAPPRVIFPSSIAVFGGTLPDIVDDSLAQRPQTSYGTHKAIAELMLADATRHGLIDGRALRLPIVLVHPGPPTQSVSDRIAAIVRDAVAGRDVTIPLKSETRVPVTSVQSVASGLIALHNADKTKLDSFTAFNLPALTVSMTDIAAVLRNAVPGIDDRKLTYAPQPELEAIVASWPKGFASRYAERIGIAADTDFAAIVSAYIASRQP
jgi:nucleoside-diphosphate-sugar epimerase